MVPTVQHSVELTLEDDLAVPVVGQVKVMKREAGLRGTLKVGNEPAGINQRCFNVPFPFIA